MLAYVVRTTVKPADEVDARLRHEAERRGMTVSSLVREAIEEHRGVRPGRRRLLSAAADRLRMAQLVARYSDLPLGTVDASVVATAERLGARSVATLDRRHFTLVRPAHPGTFELVP